MQNPMLTTKKSNKLPHGQARNQVLVLGKNTFLGVKIFVFIICWKPIFLRTTELGVTKNVGALPPVATGLHPS